VYKAERKTSAADGKYKFETDVQGRAGDVDVVGRIALRSIL
jgi:hypothetical protein